jgi:membrane peptidoglycan carboxypeptidase
VSEPRRPSGDRNQPGSSASNRPPGTPQQRPGGNRPPNQPGNNPGNKPSLAQRWKRRRAAKKRRIAAMSRKRRIWRRVAILGTWLLGFFAAIMVVAVVLFYNLSDVPRPETRPLPQTAEILYSDGSLLAKVGTVDRTIVSLDRVPQTVQWDVLAAEDRNFYHEPGVSITGTLRAGVHDVTGGDTQGGSGITQQYVKNAYLSNSQTLSRKLKELAIAVKLSREYSKDQILEFYLNTVYFGRGAYGIEAAAEAFFGKHVGQLDTAEGAVLAALLRAPSFYDPAINPADAKARWHYVLSGMVATGHLSQQQADTMSYPKVRDPQNNTGLGITGPKALIVQRVIDELQANGISESEMYARGLRVQTTISHRAQADAESAIKQTFRGLTHRQRDMKNALVAISPTTGAVIAYYGGPDGKNYAGKRDAFDYASLGSASPGSSFKPYTLATALTQTVQKKSAGTPYTINSIVNGSQCVNIEATRICNDPSDAPYSSPRVKVADAMKFSLNTTFDLMAARVGPSNVADTAHAAGISREINGRPSLTGPGGKTSFGIGIGDYPVHPIDQAVGFATFANGGIHHSAYFVRKATASDGEVIYQHHDKGTRAIDAKVANDVTMTLEPVAAWSGVALANGRQSAAKTGTEGIEVGKFKGGNSDAWMVGYTPQISTAVWVGSGNSTKPIFDASGGPEYGRDLPGQAWKLFMDKVLSNRKQLPLPHKQLIHSAAAHTFTPTPTPTHTSAPPTTAPPSTSSTPPPPPTTSAPPPKPTPTPTPSPSCTPGIVLPNCPTPTPTPTGTQPPNGSGAP